MAVPGEPRAQLGNQCIQPKLGEDGMPRVLRRFTPETGVFRNKEDRSRSRCSQHMEKESAIRVLGVALGKLRPLSSKRVVERTGWVPGPIQVRS